jgi:tRNA U34 5-methylaminomethyl-2-thiouridine-forming methyltransferase MnmC
MPHELFVTEDGSHSIKIPELNVSYHSSHGAVAESTHIFINAGLHEKSRQQKKINVFEAGFGTGLNALLTLIDAEKNDLQILYDVAELYPLDRVFVDALNYLSILKAPEYLSVFRHMHEGDWNVPLQVTRHFTLQKVLADIRQVEFTSQYDVVYFDAFDPVAQPELWTREVFTRLYESMNETGVLVTYSSKSKVRRALSDAGFYVTKLPGPKGKREITRAIKRV